MIRRRSLALGVGLALLAPLVAPGGAGAATDAVVTDAEAWLLAQQQADGGFEVAQFPGFETPDAILALAEASQPGPFWDFALASTTMSAITSSGGKDPLDAIDDLVDSDVDPTTNAAGARAAKISVLVGQPLGLNLSDFDPSGDSEAAVDLLARIDLHKQEDGSYEFGAQFNGVLYTAIALAGNGDEVPAGLIGQIRTAQRSDGSWDYTGTTTGDGDDIDTTALALIALRSGGLTTADAEVAAGVAFLAARQQASGAWQAFGADDPNTTGVATVALSDLHIDTTTAGWRTTFGTPATGTYVSPQAWIASQQAEDGHIASPNDGWGVNTFATSQATQALARQWFLNGERELLIEDWSRTLASPAANPVSTVGNELASDLVGGNPSTKSARSAAAGGLVNGPVGREAAAADLFQQAFNRAIDPSGRAYWSNKLFTISRPEMLARLTGSSEFYRKAGGTIPTFVDAVYQSVLGRAADPSGRAYWIGRLNAGRSVESVARSLVASPEYRRRQVDNAFDRLLDRAPTAGERTYWTNKIATTRIEVLLVTLASSAEFYELASA